MLPSNCSPCFQLCLTLIFVENDHPIHQSCLSVIKDMTVVVVKNETAFEAQADDLMDVP